MEEDDISRTLELKRPLAMLAVGFGVVHLFTMLLAIFPHGWGINRMLESYRRVTSPQEWGMFHTIPTLQGHEISVVVGDESFGALLPGLREYRTHSRIRHYYAFNRLLDLGSDYFDGYLENLKGALVEAGVGEGEFSLKVELDYTRLLKLIDEDGEMTLRRSDDRGPFKIDLP